MHKLNPLTLSLMASVLAPSRMLFDEMVPAASRFWQEKRGGKHNTKGSKQHVFKFACITTKPYGSVGPHKVVTSVRDAWDYPMRRGYRKGVNTVPRGYAGTIHSISFPH